MSQPDDSNPKSSSSLPWYKDGLNFKCTECGKCCTGSPGYVWVTEEEMAKMAEVLNITVDIFKRKYTRQRDNRYALIEKSHSNYDCIFLRDKMCLVYQARPTQCRTYPWWKENLASKDSWLEAGNYCEGINEKAPVVPYSKIQEQLEINEGSKNNSKLKVHTNTSTEL